MPNEVKAADAGAADIESLTSPPQVIVTEDSKANMVVELMSNIQVANHSMSDVVVGLDSADCSTSFYPPSSCHQCLLYPQEENPLPLQVQQHRFMYFLLDVKTVCICDISCCLND